VFFSTPSSPRDRTQDTDVQVFGADDIATDEFARHSTVPDEVDAASSPEVPALTETTALPTVAAGVLMSVLP